MDAKIKELLTRLSFFAEDGMADKPIVEIAKQADALLLEVARKPNTQQPVAWIEACDIDDLYAEGAATVLIRADMPEYECIPLWLSPPVPRDVLMALAEEVRKAAYDVSYDRDADINAERIEHLDIAAIADRYASKVQQEPVNQQLLAALKDIASDYADRFDLSSSSTNPGIKIVIEQARSAIASAEAAQPQPASVQPVVVPDEMKIIGLHPTEYSLGYEYGWNACRAAMLSALHQVVVSKIDESNG